jgi:hypothetical protein
MDSPLSSSPRRRKLGRTNKPAAGPFAWLQRHPVAAAAVYMMIGGCIGQHRPLIMHGSSTGVSTGVGASLAHTYLAALGNPFRSKRRAALGLIAACDSIVPANINMVDVCLLTTQPSQIRVSASLYFHLAARHWPAQPYSWHWLHSCSLYT